MDEAKEELVAVWGSGGYCRMVNVHDASSSRKGSSNIPVSTCAASVLHAKTPSVAIKQQEATISHNTF